MPQHFFGLLQNWKNGYQSKPFAHSLLQFTRTNIKIVFAHPFVLLQFVSSDACAYCMIRSRRNEIYCSPLIRQTETYILRSIICHTLNLSMDHKSMAYLEGFELRYPTREFSRSRTFHGCCRISHIFHIFARMLNSQSSPA